MNVKSVRGLTVWQILSPALWLLLCACDESDPATSEHCVAIRMRYIEAKYHRDQAREAEAALGFAPDRSLDLALAKLQNENWQCFK